MKIDNDSIITIHSDVLAWRRHLHMYPELSFQEMKTSSWIADKLKLWKIDVRSNIAGYGVVGKLRGLKPVSSDHTGRHIALRADIDALPIQDEKSVFYQSRVPGVMHACGHDGHTAMLLGAAKWFADHREQWSGEITFLFQPAEEVNPGGAKAMIEAGVLEGVDEIFGLHLWTPLPVGTISSCSGAMLASVDEFSIEIQGKGGHAALPHETIDSVLVGAALVQAFQTIISRNVDPLDHAVLTVGSLHAGHTFNVIAERANLSGTVRTFKHETRALIEQRVNEVLTHICGLYGAKAELTYEHGYPSLINHSQSVERAKRLVMERITSCTWKDAVPVMAGEDFSYYLQKVPGCFLFIGAGNAQVDACYPHHHPRFNIDETALQHGVELLIHLTQDALLN